MSIYISCHPLDRYFATVLLANLRNIGFALDFLPLNCGKNIIDAISKDDVLILILRPEYIKSKYYAHLVAQFTNCTVLPVLRSPITIENWGENVILNPILDFSSHDQHQFLLNMNVLGKKLASHCEVSRIVKPSTQEIHMNYLEAKLEQSYFLFNVLEKMNYGWDTQSKNPVQILFSETRFNVSSHHPERLFAEKYGLSTTDYLEHIANCHQTFTLICDYLDSQLVATFLADLARQKYVASDGKTPIPVLINVETWTNDPQWDKWLGNEFDPNDTSADNLLISDLVVFVHGFEHSYLNVSQFKESFKSLWRFSSPPPPFVIVCPYLDNNPIDKLSDNIVVVRPTKYDLDQLKYLYLKYLDRPFARFVVDCINNAAITPLLRYLLDNPIFAAGLLSLRFEPNIEFPKQTLNVFFQHFIGSLWNIDNDSYSGNFSELTDALSKIAAIVTERQKPFITYREALNFLQSEALLNKCIDRCIFLFENNELRFSAMIIQNYLAALALAQYGIPSQLPQLSLTSESSRVPQRWDNSIIILSHLVASPEEMIKTIADFDPLLALKCVASGIRLNTIPYAYVIDKNLEALVNIGDFRVSFAKLLYDIDSTAARAIFVEVLRNAQWSIRVSASSIFQELDKNTMYGLVESLTGVNDQARGNMIHALKRIGVNAFPTMFQLLKYDNVEMKLNAIWAIKELNDRAFVPSLVSVLCDNNLSVATKSVYALGSLHDTQSVPYLIRFLQHRHKNMRNAVRNALFEIQNSETELFMDVVRKIDAASRRLLMVHLSAFQTHTLLDFLLAFSYDEDVDVKIAAIKGLATIAEPRVISRLEECLEDMSKSRLYKSSVNEIVSKILSNILGNPVAKLINMEGQNPSSSSQIVKYRLMNAKEQRSDHKQLNSAETILSPSDQLTETLDSSQAGEILLASEDAYVSDILAQLRSGKWNASSNAAKTLREYVKTLHGNTSLPAVNQILEILNDENWVIRWTGVETLGWVGNVHVVPHLIQRLTDLNWKVKLAAVRALVEINDNKAIVGVSKLVSDNNPLVREAAAEALGFLDGSQAIPALEAAALDSEEFVRLAAIESLGKTRDRVATRTLLSALKDPSEHVRWAAANGLIGNAGDNMVSALIPSLSDTAGPYWEQKRICDVIVDILKQIDSEEADVALARWQSIQT